MTSPLIPEELTDRAFQARAWERLREMRAKRPGWSLDQALEHPTVGRVIRAMAAQLRQQHAKVLEVERKAARFGRKVEWTGYGHKPIKPQKI